MLYELLTGVYPISGSDYKTLIAGHLFRPPLDFDESDPEGRVPLELREATLRALAKEPQDRYPSAKEFSDACRKIQQTWMQATGITAFDEAAFFRAVKDATDDPADRVGSTQDRLDYRFPGGEGSDDGTLDTGQTRIQGPAAESPASLEGETKQVPVREIEGDVQGLLSDAYKLMLAKEYAPANDKLLQAQLLEPDNTEVARLLGEAEIALTRVARENELSKALEGRTKEIWELLDGGNLTAAQELLVATELELGESEPLKTLRWRLETVVNRRRAARVQELLEEANVQFGAGELAGARDSVEALLALEPEHGEAAELEQRIEGAESEAKAALRLREVLDSLVVRAKAEADAARYEDALALLDEADQLDVEDEEVAVLRNGYQIALEIKGREEAAREALAALDQKVHDELSAGRVVAAEQVLEQAAEEQGVMERSIVQELHAEVEAARDDQLTAAFEDSAKLENTGQLAKALAALEVVRELAPARVAESMQRLQSTIASARERDDTIQGFLLTAEDRKRAGDLQGVLDATQIILQLDPKHGKASRLAEKAEAALEKAERKRAEAEEVARRREVEEAGRERLAAEKRGARVAELVAKGTQQLEAGELAEAHALAEQAHALAPDDPAPTRLIEQAKARRAQPPAPTKLVDTKKEAPEPPAPTRLVDTPKVASPKLAAPTALVDSPGSPVPRAEPLAPRPDTAPAAAPQQGPAFEPLVVPTTVSAPAGPGVLRDKRTWIGVVIAALVLIAAIMAISREPSTPKQVRKILDDQPQQGVPPVVGGIAVTVDAVPWAEVIAVIAGDGGSVDLPDEAYTPLVLDLVPGHYAVTLAHPQLGEQTCEIEVEVGHTATCFLALVEIDEAFVDDYLASAGWEPGS